MKAAESTQFLLIEQRDVCCDAASRTWEMVEPPRPHVDLLRGDPLGNFDDRPNQNGESVAADGRR
jgi:hypothetical protein